MNKNDSCSNSLLVKNCKRKAATTASQNLSKKQASSCLKRVSSLLRKKNKLSLSEEEKHFLKENSELVNQFYKRREKRDESLRRLTELEDSPVLLEQKCLELAQAIHDADFLIVYTGAGISTSASIPDYRGPNGIWTRLKRGQDIGKHDLTTAEPTSTHMALSYLYNKGIVRHVVSQNCDGLHLRSGLPKTAVSEVHGNMYIEVCKHCRPAREYVRIFDVTENTSKFKHKTGRRCYRCGEPLVDTIVHFGERGKLRWPLNWQGACQSAKACDTILCLGSSLKVLRKYPWLWQMERPVKRRPKLYIVNLQWTPKDKDATTKINGKCDNVMKLVMKFLGLEIPKYIKKDDPIFHMYTPVHTDELCTFSQPVIASNNDSSCDGYECAKNVSIRFSEIASTSISATPTTPLACSVTTVDLCCSSKAVSTEINPPVSLERIDKDSLASNIELQGIVTKSSSSSIFTTTTTSTVATTFCTETEASHASLISSSLANVNSYHLNPSDSLLLLEQRIACKVKEKDSFYQRLSKKEFKEDDVHSQNTFTISNCSQLSPGLVCSHKSMGESQFSKINPLENGSCHFKLPNGFQKNYNNQNFPSCLGNQQSLRVYRKCDSEDKIKLQTELDLEVKPHCKLKYEPNCWEVSNKDQVNSYSHSGIKTEYSSDFETDKDSKLLVKSEIDSILENGVCDGLAQNENNCRIEEIKVESKFKNSCSEVNSEHEFNNINYHSGNYANHILRNECNLTNLLKQDSCTMCDKEILLKRQCSTDQSNRVAVIKERQCSTDQSNRVAIIKDNILETKSERGILKYHLTTDGLNLKSGETDELKIASDLSSINEDLKVDTASEINSPTCTNSEIQDKLSTPMKTHDYNLGLSKDLNVKTKIINSIFSNKKRSPGKSQIAQSFLFNDDVGCKMDAKFDEIQSFNFNSKVDGEQNVCEEASLKDLDSHVFYGTGLCIRSIPVNGSDNMDEEYFSIEEDTYTDNSLQFDLMETDAEEILEKINGKMVNTSSSKAANYNTVPSSICKKLKFNAKDSYQLGNRDSVADLFGYCNGSVKVVNGGNNLTLPRNVSLQTQSCSTIQNISVDDDLKVSLNCVKLSPTDITSEIKNPELRCEIPVTLLSSPPVGGDGDDQSSFLLHTQVVDGVIQVTNFKSKTNLAVLSDTDELGAKSNLMDLENKNFREIWRQSFLDSSVKINLPTSEMLDDEVKRLWFWGFESTPKEDEEAKVKTVKKRVTRSAYIKGSKSTSPRSKKKCNCRVENPQLCKRSQELSNNLVQEERMLKVRESIKRRRANNYIKYEPIFEIRLKNNTCQKVKVRKPSKCWYEESDSGEEEKSNDSSPEETCEIRTDEKKIVPGWYGKGYKKGLKKRRQYTRSNSAVPS